MLLTGAWTLDRYAQAMGDNDPMICQWHTMHNFIDYTVNIRPSTCENQVQTFRTSLFAINEAPKHGCMHGHAHPHIHNTQSNQNETLGTCQLSYLLDVTLPETEYCGKREK